MKNLKKLFIVFATIIALKINSQTQVNFSISPSFCAGDMTTVFSSISNAFTYSWAALPAGPVFSASSASITNITFPSPGTYTIGHGVLTGSGASYTTQVVLVNASPTLAISGLNVSCPAHPATLTASGAGGYTWTPANSLNTNTGATVVSSPATSTTYTLIGSIGSCTASASHLVNSVQMPNISVVASQYSVCAGFTSTLTALGASSYTWTGGALTNPSFQHSLSVTAGTYFVTGSNGGNCSSTTSVNIVSSPPLAIQISQSSATTCIASNSPVKFSKPVSLSASGAATYAWFPYNPSTMTYSIGPNITVRPIANTCYTVIGSTPSCSGSAVACVTVIPQFTVGILPAVPPQICQGDLLILNVNGIGSPASGQPSLFNYMWSEPLNAPPVSMSSYYGQIVTVFPQNTCTYTLEVEDGDDCISLPEMVTVSVTVCNGLETIAMTNQFQLFPNPSNDLIYIRSDKNELLSVQIIDAMGKEIMQKKLNGNSEQSLKLEMPAGVYFVKIISASGYSELKRLIKE